MRNSNLKASPSFPALILTCDGEVNDYRVLKEECVYLNRLNASLQRPFQSSIAENIWVCAHIVVNKILSVNLKAPIYIGMGYVSSFTRRFIFEIRGGLLSSIADTLFQRYERFLNIPRDRL